MNSSQRKSLSLTVFFSVVGLLWSMNTQAQCNIVAAADTIVGCAGDTVALGASGATNYEWSGSPNLSCTTCASPTYVVQPGDTLIVKGTSGTSSIALNGNFSSGNSGFQTNYTYNPTSIWNEGTYAIGPNPNTVHPNFGTWGDHTTGSGNYMLINGSTSGNRSLWRQTVSFPPGTQVTMSMWYLTFVTPAGSLNLRVNGSQVGATFSTPATTGTWGNITRTFTVPASGTCNINIITTSSAVAGNDFGMDDISYSYQCESYDTIYVVADNPPVLAASASDSAGCDNLCVQWDNQSTGDTATASFWWDYGDGSPLDTAYDGQHCYNAPGTYWPVMYAASSLGCPAQLDLPSVQIDATPSVSSITPSGGQWEGNVYVVPNDPATVAIQASFFNGAGATATVYWGDGSTETQQLAGNTWNASHSYIDLNESNICIAVSSPLGCSDSTCITIDFTTGVEISNVFSPNGDGVNDVYIPDFIAADRVEWEVFSRWGTRIFQANSLEEAWDGTYNGRLVSEGVYFVVVRAYSAWEETPIERHGTVHVFH